MNDCAPPSVKIFGFFVNTLWIWITFNLMPQCVFVEIIFIVHAEISQKGSQAKTSWENIDTSSIKYFPRQTGALIGPHKNICDLIGWLSRVVYSSAAEQSSVGAVQPSKGGASRVLLVSSFR